MDPAVFSLIGFLLIALVFSFLCSVLEAVLLSITPSFVASQQGALGERLKHLKSDIDRPLSAILTLNTFAHTIGAAGVGASAQKIWGESSLTIVSGVVTIVILVGSEIIPKTIGAVYWQKLVGIVSVTCQWLTWILYPVVIASLLITRLFRTEDQQSILSRKEVSQVVKFGYLDGLIKEHEKDIIVNLMKQDRLMIHDIMTPAERLVMLNAELNISAIHPHSKPWHVSRVPVYEGSENNITGYVLKDEALGAQLMGQGDKSLASIAKKIMNVGPSTELKDLYHQLVSADEHIAIVKEDDKVIGVVTMEDVIEEILGQEIIDESDRARGVLD